MEVINEKGVEFLRNAVSASFVELNLHMIRNPGAIKILAAAHNRIIITRGFL
ncbi:TPA: hypothetical protein HA338_13625 [Methanosarcina acetivorans]|uniref:Uncharacterized protein n=1 Tax=Methanosarcina acetivorans TaxID=2214 RepID=A0A832SAT7_9EURY|nr:hypothetical protein [Methanosarcina acetivorans]HIH95003.1 hypothetical protein [Methanosarcina acetivorans]